MIWRSPDRHATKLPESCTTVDQLDGAVDLQICAFDLTQRPLVSWICDWEGSLATWQRSNNATNDGNRETWLHYLGSRPKYDAVQESPYCVITV